MARRLLGVAGWSVLLLWAAAGAAVAVGHTRPYQPMFAYTQRAAASVYSALYLYDPQTRVHYRVPGPLNMNGNTDWSADGDGVAVSLSFTTDPAQYVLGEGWRQLNTPLAISPRVPPYQSERYYLQTEQAGMGWDVLAIDAEIGTSTTIDALRGVPEPPQLLWLPDGERVLAFVQIGDTLQISIHNPATQQRTLNERLPNTELIPYTLRRAPGQPWLAFRTRPAGPAPVSETLYVLDLANERVQRVAALPLGATTVGFRPGTGWN